ncbi:hypothetical protein [Bradyrhizobium sp. MOS002]|uniref:hypothetical protein n=1 Tax=Bradyrhizobium sp. MOS002 TaxID=2133947 RepID=UPI000D122E9E|nr:hypothetical protein [Bradyrhizobium sp. MOS002]PSO30116.1 hypothetical protein C7G41_22725 [Bradyrhizobium sp. MOS002]
MTTDIPRDAAGEPLLTRCLDQRARQGDFPRRVVETVGDLGKLLADYAGQCDRELSDISLTSFWPSLSAIILSSMDNDAGRRNTMRTEFFVALADRIRSVRTLHVECDAWIAREHKRQVAAARRAVSWTGENKRLKARVTELEAELERRSGAWPRAVGE